MRGGRLTHFIHPDEKHYETRLTLQHPTLHLQATEVTTEDNTGKKNHIMNPSAAELRIPEYLGGAPPPSRRSGTSGLRIAPAHLCPPLHMNATHRKMNCKNNHVVFLTIRSNNRDSLIDQILFCMQESRMVAESGSLLIQSRRYICT